MKESKSNVFNFILSFVITTIAYTSLVYVIFSVNIYKSLISGIIGGFLFTMILMYETELIRKAMIEKMPSDCEYNVLANHMVIGQAIGGMLYICEQEVHFISHGKNFKEEYHIIPYTDIKIAKHGLFPRIVQLCLKGGNKQKYLVNRPKTVIARINAHILSL